MSVRTGQTVGSEKEQEVAHVHAVDAVQIERTIYGAPKLAQEQEDVIDVHEAIVVEVLGAVCSLFRGKRSATAVIVHAILRTRSARVDVIT